MKIRATIGAAVALVAISQAAHAAWPPLSTNLAVCDTAGSQDQIRAVPDGSGGALFAWRDQRDLSTSGMDVYVQRVNALGNVLWTVNGVAACSTSSNQDDPVLVGDGSGGVIVAWRDFRQGNHDVYAQRIDASGSERWAVNGVPICTHPASQFDLAIASDDSGGAVIVWTDGRSVDDVYAQRVDGNGIVRWAVDGVPVAAAVGTQQLAAAVSDGQGRVIVAWGDARSGLPDIYAQALDRSGTSLWAANGVPICQAADRQVAPEVAHDGASGALITWRDLRNGFSNADIFVQRIDAFGVAQWTTDGVPVCTASGSQESPHIVSDEQGGAILAWQDLRNAFPRLGDIYAQRVDAGGTPLWTPNGIVVCGADRTQANPAVVPDGLGGAIVVWDDQRVSTKTVVYAQRIDPDSASLWTPDGEVTSTASGNKNMPAAVPAGPGAVIIGWHDHRGGSTPPEVYAQIMPEEGAVSVGPPGRSAIVELAPVSPNPFRAGTTIRFVLPVPERVRLGVHDVHGRRVRSLFEGDLPASAHVMAWNGMDDRGVALRSGVYFVRLMTQGGESVVRAIRIE